MISVPLSQNEMLVRFVICTISEVGDRIVTSGAPTDMRSTMDKPSVSSCLVGTRT